MPWIILGALAIGLSLGMLGSGGSILTVPVLTYLVGQPEKLAIASSLAIVGGISAIAVIPYAWKREIDWRSVIWFGLPGMLSTWLGAMMAQGLPGFIQLLIFSAIMFMASWRMINSKNIVALAPDVAMPGVSKLKMIRTGLMVGFVTGVVGVGGGSLIVPALILLVGLNMRRAVGSSLVVVSSNAFSGFIKYAGSLKALHLVLNWQVIGMFILIGGTGTIAGNMLGSRLPQQRLKQIFGVLLVGMAIYIIIRELPKLFHT